MMEVDGTRPSDHPRKIFWACEELGLAGSIEAKDVGSGSDNWSFNSCKLQSNRHHQ